jgi:hypothetical protein
MFTITPGTRSLCERHGADPRPRGASLAPVISRGSTRGKDTAPGPTPAATPGASHRQPCSSTRTSAPRTPGPSEGDTRGRTGRSTGATAAARDDPWRSPHPGTPSWSGAAATTVFQRLHMPPLAGATAWLNSDPIEPPACAAALSWWTAVRLVILISLAGPVRSTCERDRASPASGGVIGRRSNVRRWSTAAYSESHDSPLFTWCSLIKWTI